MNLRDGLAILGAMVLAGVELAAARPRATTEPPQARAATLREPPAAPPEKRVCSPLRVEVPRVKPSDLNLPETDIDDPSGALEHFHARAAALLAGERTHVRAGLYADSQGLKDYFGGSLRRRLHASGDAGHGFVAIGRPWGWYTHAGVEVDHAFEGSWATYNASTRPAFDDHYGHAFAVSESFAIGARGRVRGHASSVEVSYEAGPRFGSFDVEIDGARVATVDTSKKTESGAGFSRLVFPDGVHTFDVVAKGPRSVRIFGVALERDAPGFVLDSLQVGSGNLTVLALGDEPMFRATASQRDYDLVIVHLGSNLFFPERVFPGFRRLFARIRAALPKTSILVMTPVDYLAGLVPPRSTSWMVRTIAEIKRAAADSKVALWDFHAAMGGDGSFAQFRARDMNMPGDWVHLGDAGMDLMAERFHAALWRSLAKFSASREATCPPPP